MQEAITRVLLERLIVHRPHPWGLLITFIELIKNPRYDSELEVHMPPCEPCVNVSVVLLGLSRAIEEQQVYSAVRGTCLCLCYMMCVLGSGVGRWGVSPCLARQRLVTLRAHTHPPPSPCCQV